MNVRIEDYHSSDEDEPGVEHAHHGIQKPDRLILQPSSKKTPKVDPRGGPGVYGRPQHHSKLMEVGEKKPQASRRRKSRRHDSRKYAEQKIDNVTAGADQDSDDVLDDYYGGTPMTSMHVQHSMPSYNPYLPLPYDYPGYSRPPQLYAGAEISGQDPIYPQHGMPNPFSPRPEGYPSPPPAHPGPARPSIHIYNELDPEISSRPPRPQMHSQKPSGFAFEAAPPAMGSGPPRPPPPGATPAGFLDPDEPGPHYTSVPIYRPTHDVRPTRMPDMTTIRTPPSKHTGGLWNRAAIPASTIGSMKLTLKLVLTRKGERYKGRPFSYETGSWDDVVFAHHLRKEYRSLKTDQIGLMQKLTSYKTISFIYFLQYHAFEDPGFAFGRWEITDRVPIVPREDEKARSFFMYQFKRRVRKVSKILSTLSEKEPPARKRPRDWIRRLEFLIEPGAVIDIEVKETFDSMKIYFGLLLAVLLSLGAALAYGFVMDNDFSTGFSIASWLLTAFGFFAAVVAAGEYLGLDSPTATLSAAQELKAGEKLNRELLDHRMYER